MTSANEAIAWIQDQANQADPLIILACRQGRMDVLDYLVQQGADLRALDRHGNNALWAACYAESSSCIEWLLAAGVDIDYQNPGGATALIYASSSGKHGVVLQLLQAGANPALTTMDDFNALDLAANRECLRLLKPAPSQFRNRKGY